MANRDDLLQELGLWPRWTMRQREAAAASPPVTAMPGASPLPIAVADSAPRAVARGAPAASDDARAARIAALAWDDFAADVDACIACGLCRTRNRSVPGVGDTAADWLFVGEAPGADEDARGEPFVGQAGKLLDAMLAALGLARGSNVYIANVLKCRPPNNRTPEPLEVAACRPYLDRQVALIEPKVIVALGKSAANTLLEREATIGSLRGRVHRFRGVPLVVTYHPAYLLRTLADKAKAWEDLVLARRALRDAGGEAVAHDRG